MNNTSKEGCQLFGSIVVNKIAGNFHIALGQSFEKHHVHGRQYSFVFQKHPFIF